MRLVFLVIMDCTRRFKEYIHNLQMYSLPNEVEEDATWESLNILDYGKERDEELQRIGEEPTYNPLTDQNVGEEVIVDLIEHGHLSKYGLGRGEYPDSYLRNTHKKYRAGIGSGGLPNTSFKKDWGNK